MTADRKFVNDMLAYVNINEFQTLHAYPLGGHRLLVLNAFQALRMKPLHEDFTPAEARLAYALLSAVQLRDYLYRHPDASEENIRESIANVRGRLDQAPAGQRQVPRQELEQDIAAILGRDLQEIRSENRNAPYWAR